MFKLHLNINQMLRKQEQLKAQQILKSCSTTHYQPHQLFLFINFKFLKDTSLPSVTINNTVF